MTLKSKLFYAFIFSSPFFSFAESQYRQNQLLNRKEKAILAADAFLKLDFFSRGRGMIMPPDFPPIDLSNPFGGIVVGAIQQGLNDNFGLIVNKNKITGFKQISYENHKVGVVSCSMCHAGKAAGVFIPGLGNKNIDIYSLATKALSVMPMWENTLGPTDQAGQAVATNAKFFLKAVSNPELKNSTQGLIPTALIRKWFFDQAGTELDNKTPSQVKIPALWGYGEKRKIGSFSDGGGLGILPGWAVAVELVAGQTVENVREYLPKIEEAENLLADFLPPSYPFNVNSEMAAKGQKLFEKKCSGCHGTYSKDLDGYPIYMAPKLIPIEEIKTDTGRLAGITAEFLNVVSINPLRDIIQASGNEPGYIAPRLVGIWARFPYLHNGSIPTIYDLLLPENLRPKSFSLRSAGDAERFDAKKLGLTANLNSSELLKFKKQKARWIYDTERFEHSNKGHNFNLNSELSDKERFEIIEYLKTI